MRVSTPRIHELHIEIVVVVPRFDLLEVQYVCLKIGSYHKPCGKNTSSVAMVLGLQLEVINS